VKQTYRLADIASRLGLSYAGDGNAEIEDAAPLDRAGRSDIAYFAAPRYRSALAASQAGVVLLKPGDEGERPGHYLYSPEPLVDFARLAALFDPAPELSGLAPDAVIDPSATLGQDVAVGPLAVIGAGAVIGDGCMIGPGVVIGADCLLGAGCTIHARAVLAHGVRLGARVIVHPGAVLGSDGFGLAPTAAGWRKIPQIGSVVIGDDCEIGANTTIDRGALGDTVLENDVRIDNLVQVAHNVRIGAHTAIAACVGIAGSAVIGRHCLIGGAAAILGHIRIGDRVTIHGMSSVCHSITEPGEYGAVVAAQPARRWWRNHARLARLDALFRKLDDIIRPIDQKRAAENPSDRR